MLKSQIELGGTYEVRWHDGRLTEVRITHELRRTRGHGSRSGRLSTQTHYSGVNLATGRVVEIKSAAKLRRRVA